MKFKKYFLIFGIIILTLLTITTVSAADNQTDAESFDSSDNIYFEDMTIENNDEDTYTSELDNKNLPSESNEINTYENHTDDCKENVDIYKGYGWGYNGTITPWYITNPVDGQNAV